MGGNASIPEDQLADLLHSTNFDKKQLKRFYSKFIKDCPDGKLSKEQFFEVYGKVYQSNFCNHLAEHIFSSFDQNQDGVISFEELVTTLSVTSRGTREEKLHWLFNLYDLDKDGRITLDEVSHMTQCVQNQGHHSEHKENEFEEDQNKEKQETDPSCSSHSHPIIKDDNLFADDDIVEIFDIVDRDSNGYWSFDEFEKAVDLYPTFVQMLDHVATPQKKDTEMP